MTVVAAVSTPIDHLVDLAIGLDELTELLERFPGPFGALLRRGRAWVSGR